MTSNQSQELQRRLRVAGPEGLMELLRAHLVELDPPSLRLLFRNPHLNREMIEMVLSERRLLTFQEVRKELVKHRLTPEVRALRFVSGLFWRDLLDITGDNRIRPRLRRAAEQHLLQRLAGLGAGEKATIARRAGPLLVSQLRGDSEPRVIRALLENPRLTEGALIPLVSSETAKPEILTLVARNPKWGIRYPIRVSLARNRRTPVQLTLSILPHLKKVDLKGIEGDRRLPMPVRRRAGVLLGRTHA